MKKLYAIDLDGTLFYPKHPHVILTKKSKNIIKKIINNGDVFSVVSGRNFTSCRRVFSLLKEEPYIVGCNGSYIYLKDKYLKDETIEKEAVREVYDYVKTHFKTIASYVMTNDDQFVLENTLPNFFYRIGQKIYDFFQGNLLEKYVIDSKLFNENIDNNKTRKLMFIFGITNKAKKVASEATKELHKVFKDKVEICWSNQAVEISPKGCTKSEGILELAKVLDIKKENIIVMGDSGNDIPMFKTFHENSYCIKKANKKVKKHAKYTIKNFNKIGKKI